MSVLTQGFLTLANTGVITYNLGISTTPAWIDVIVCERTGGDSSDHRSTGYAIVGNQRCFSTLEGVGSFNSSTHVVRHYEQPGVLVLSAKFHSFTSTGVRFDVDIPNLNYRVFVRVGI